MSANTGKCTGVCCKDFTLTQSPMELDIIYHMALKGKVMPSRHIPVPDVLELVPILIYRYASYYVRQCVKFDVNQKSPTRRKYWVKDDQQRYYWHYTCKHHDKETKKCLIYDNRPKMCRNFCCSDSANYPGCTLRETPDNK